MLQALAAASAFPCLRGFAQSQPPRKIGFLAGLKPGSPESPVWLRDRLKPLGYEEGRNLVIERRWSGGANDRLPVLARELVERQVEVIVAFSNGAIDAARKATNTIPIVMVYGVAPVEAGFVQSLSRPGGNITGTAFHSPETTAKSLDLAIEAFPRAKRFALLLASFDRPGYDSYSRALGKLAGERGLDLQVIGYARQADMADALARVQSARPDVLLVGNDTALDETSIVDFAIRQKLPTIGTVPGWVDRGGLFYFGPDEGEPIVRTPHYVARLLQGAKAAELPVELPSIYRFSINARTAQIVGYSISEAFRIRADRIVDR